MYPTFATARTKRHPLPWFSHYTTLTMLVIGVALGGCDAPNDRPDNTPARDAQRPATSSETWDAVFQGDAKIGYSHTRIEPLRDDTGARIKITREQHLKLQRFGQSLEVTVHIESVESTDGAVKSFVMRTEAGPSPIVVTGEISAHQLHITTTSQGKRSTRAIDWPPGTGGFFADELSLKRSPMKPGEQRQLKTLWPGLAGVRIISMDLAALAPEDATLLDGVRRLLKIRTTIRIGDQSIEGFYWTTESGALLKTMLAGMKQITYRTTKAVALAKSSGMTFDLGRDSVVHVATPLPHPYQTARVVYQAHLRDANPVAVFVAQCGQQVTPIDAHSARITVTAVRPDQPEKVASTTPPKPMDSAPNNMIQSDDPQVVKLAGQVATHTDDAWQVALALEKWVCEAIQKKNFTQGFATAADVARTLEGDCTEHAVLLAALCRARGIPTRVAVGLIYSEHDQGFAFHMWDQVWIRDRWIPIDGTLGLGGSDAAHITLGTSSLSTSEAETMILRVAKVLGQLELRILDVKPGSPAAPSGRAPKN